MTITTNSVLDGLKTRLETIANVSVVRTTFDPSEYFDIVSKQMWPGDSNSLLVIHEQDAIIKNDEMAGTSDHNSQELESPSLWVFVKNADSYGDLASDLATLVDTIIDTVKADITLGGQAISTRLLERTTSETVVPPYAGRVIETEIIYRRT